MPLIKWTLCMLNTVKKSFLICVHCLFYIIYHQFQWIKCLYLVLEFAPARRFIPGDYSFIAFTLAPLVQTSLRMIYWTSVKNSQIRRWKAGMTIITILEIRCGTKTFLTFVFVFNICFCFINLLCNISKKKRKNKYWPTQWSSSTR